MWMFASMYVYVSGAHGGQKKASDLELELHVVVSHHVGAGTWTLVL